MSRTAFEIFLVDQTNYFINFPSKKVLPPLSSPSPKHGLFLCAGDEHCIQQHHPRATSEPEQGGYQEAVQVAAGVGTDQQMGQEGDLQL